MNDELEQTSSDNTSPLTMSEAIKAFTATPTEEEAHKGQSDTDEAQEGNAEDELPEDEGGEEDDGEAGDEDQAEDGEGEGDEAPESDQGRFVADNAKVRMVNPDGTVEFLTVAELKAGNLKNADATRKWQEAAELRRNAEAQSATLKQHEQQILERQAYVAELIQSIIPPPPDPAMADPRSPEYDPARYQAEDVAHRQWQAHLQYLDQQRQQADQARQAETVEAQKARLATEWQAALKALPKLADPQRLEAFGKDTVKYGMKWGFTAEELNRLPYDHRQLVVFEKAMAYDKLQAQKAAAKPKTDAPQRPPVLKGGKRMNPAQARARDANAAMERLERSGSLRDGVAAYLATQSKG